ncbi:MAG: hypothetical protein DMG70_25195 [Acidobacteria bacterium]|nr:MAG: hypothetical protein DMG70_25195 [Acidobacteriota bacterium]PYY07905.1 MAG: hypothetical protein DMG69_17370 [Acidobacteriota bacterium]
MLALGSQESNRQESTLQKPRCRGFLLVYELKQATRAAFATWQVISATTAAPQYPPVVKNKEIGVAVRINAIVGSFHPLDKT